MQASALRASCRHEPPVKAQAGRMGSVATNQAKHLKHEEEELFKMHLKDAWKLVDRPTTKALKPHRSIGRIQGKGMS